MRARLEELAARGRAELLAEGIAANRIHTTYSLDLRYQGQRFTLNVAYDTVERALAAFHRAHRRRFGHALSGAVSEPGTPIEAVILVGEQQPVPVWRREALGSGEAHSGPVLIVDDVATTFVSPGWRVSRPTIRATWRGCISTG